MPPVTASQRHTYLLPTPAFRHPQLNWNLKTDAVTAEYTLNSGIKFAAMKLPNVAVPTVGISLEKTFTA